MSTHTLCFEQKYEQCQNFLSEIFHFLVIKLSVYLNRHVFVKCFHKEVRKIFIWAQLFKASLA